MFVPIVGGISPNSINGVDVQSNQIAREFADKFGGNYTQFLAPAQFSDKKIKDYFLEEKSVNFIFDDFENWIQLLWELEQMIQEQIPH